MATCIVPNAFFLLGRLIGRGLARNFLTDEHGKVTGQTERVRLFENRLLEVRTRPVLLIAFEDCRSAGKFAVLLAMPPERRVNPGIEAIMDGEKVTNAVPMPTVQ